MKTVAKDRRKEVAAAMKHRGAHGCYPEGTDPEVVEIAEKMRAGARAISDSVEGNNARPGD